MLNFSISLADGAEKKNDKEHDQNEGHE